jgi:hypothetical protein
VRWGRNHKGFWWENLKKINNLEDLSIDERIIAEWILKKWVRRPWSGQEKLVGSCE